MTFSQGEGGTSITVTRRNIETRIGVANSPDDITKLDADLHCGACTHCMAHVALNQLTGPNGERNNFAPGMYCAHTSLDSPVLLAEIDEKSPHVDISLPASIEEIQKKTSTGLLWLDKLLAYVKLDNLFSYGVVTALVTTVDGNKHACPNGMVRSAIQRIRVSELEPGFPQDF